MCHPAHLRSGCNSQTRRFAFPFFDVVRVFVKQLSYLLHGAAMRADKRNQLPYKLVVSCVFMHILTALRWYLYAETLIFAVTFISPMVSVSCFGRLSGASISSICCSEITPAAILLSSPAHSKKCLSVERG